ncbi:tyrosine-type recombinase/integrase [candidate division TA06 bacterium]|nr:tyrosine-type recombinase/integrase [candidate division TA06 bacterium]
MNDILSAFTGQLKVKNYSAKSIAAYSGHLAGFFAYLKSQGIGDIRQVNKGAITAYLLSLREHLTKAGKPYSTSTMCLKVRAVKRLFEYLEKANVVLINPAEDIKEPKKATSLPRSVLTPEEARKILDAPNLSTTAGIRARAILEAFYSTGLRLEEMARLTIYDCDLQGGYLRVNKGKGAKDRVIPLGKHAARFLKEYITHIRPQWTKNNKGVKALLVNRQGQALSTEVIGIMVRTYARKAGITKKVSPHTFRHTFATQLVKNGADITAVQKMLGHSDLSATQVYLRVAGTEVKRTHSKSHPREREKEPGITPHIKSIKQPPQRQLPHKQSLHRPRQLP